jgi:hypothetical protein
MDGAYPLCFLGAVEKPLMGKERFIKWFGSARIY